MLFDKRFTGRTAVVTGGAAGIGLAIASRIAAEGGKVAIWDRDAKAIDGAVGDANDRGRAMKGCVVDVADTASVDGAALSAEQAAPARIDRR